MARGSARPGKQPGTPGVALVTGGARRLGRELAFGFARAGYAVAVGYRSGRADAAETVRSLRTLGVEAAAFHADLARDAAPPRLVGRVLDGLGRLDVLVHAASPWITKPVAGVTLAEWEAVFRAGPRAAFFLAQAAAAELERTGGSILLVSDVAATRAWPNHVPHAAAKAAIDALVRNLAVALGPGVRVNGLAPGIVLPPDDLAPAAVDRLVSATPLKRRVAVPDLVSMAVAVASNRSMTGQVVAVDAGRSCV
ncbi:MAG TPA: SDR family oxidoreductase [Thermoanaerobaculia bacterium]|nr:SDR family oxidoreductase [Thermoanaerobaculia bacterium]HQR66645.1 SDR family oxidoreductase [Thermoanaerobaculia bacterium]